MIKPGKTIVYIGPGWCIPGHQNGPKLQENFKYICIETPNNNLWNSVGQGFYDRFPIPLKNRVQLIRARGENTGLEDNSVDEVHLYNILGDVRIKNREKIFIEAIRITKLAGNIYVGEILTPYPIESLIKTGNEYGLTSKILINGTTSGIKEEDKETFYSLIGDYYRPSEGDLENTISSESFLIKFLKPKRQR